MIKTDLLVPNEVSYVTSKLQSVGYEAYLVGGCVRDLLLNKIPNDWDVTTNATPDQIQNIFDHTFYENDFGTVGVVNNEIIERIKLYENENVSNETSIMIKELQKISVVEVTPYRTESTYSDNRRPDKIHFSQKLEDDLKRRDFTINALCYNPATKEVVDYHNGISDLKNKIITTVGDPYTRFNEDALRMLRAIRFVSQLGFDVSNETSQSIKLNYQLIKHISKERIRDELNKIIVSHEPMNGIKSLDYHMLLEHTIPELIPMIGCSQNGSHVYDVYTHSLLALQHAADKKWSRQIRWAALLHDIGKPATKRFDKDKNDNTFYGHEVVGSKITKKILTRLKFKNEDIEYITLLVRWHMFFSDPDKITLSAVRRIIRNIGGIDKVWDLIKLRICDRIGMGRPKERPYRLRKYEAMMMEATRTPVTVKDLNINGDQIMELFQMKPGRKIGYILNILMGETLNNPDLNNYNYLVKRVSQLTDENDETLQNLAKEGTNAIDVEENKQINEIKKKFKVT